MSAYILSSLLRTVTQSTKSVLSRRMNRTGYMYSTSYEYDGKTTMSMMNSDPAAGVMIDSYSQMGFRLNNGLLVIGPMVIFPKTVLSWQVESVKAINEDSLSLFCCLEPKIDILVLGVGDTDDFSKFNWDLVRFMRKNKISVETLTTDKACSTFNFLNAERRYVAGALVPPATVRANTDDIASAKLRSKRIYGESD